MDHTNPKKLRQRARVHKTDRQSFRLGGGEFERAPETAEVTLPLIRGEGEPQRIKLDGGEWPSVRSGRKFFFAACGQVRPEFIEDLNSAPKAALQALDQSAATLTRVGALRDERGAVVGLVDKLKYSGLPWRLVKVDERYGQLREGLQAWFKRFNLHDDWLMDLALAHLCPPFWDERMLYSFPAVKTDQKLTLIAWDPTLETRAVASARMQAIIAKHLDQVEKQAEDGGLERTPERRQARHLHWLAGYQVCNWSQKRIAEAANTDRAGVVRAISNWAEFLGLTLRPPRWNDRSQTVDAIRARLALIPIT